MRHCLAILSICCMSACASAQVSKPRIGYDDPRFAAMSPCEQAAELLTYDTPYHLKQAVFERAKNMGCFGEPQRQRVEVIAR